MTCILKVTISMITECFCFTGGSLKPSPNYNIIQLEPTKLYFAIAEAFIFYFKITEATVVLKY
jgi:hypothetical protein